MEKSGDLEITGMDDDRGLVFVLLAVRKIDYSAGSNCFWRPMVVDCTIDGNIVDGDSELKNLHDKMEAAASLQLENEEDDYDGGAIFGETLSKFENALKVAIEEISDGVLWEE